jgi:hypothetical protein
MVITKAGGKYLIEVWKILFINNNKIILTNN